MPEPINISKDRVTYDLPKSKDTKVFGPDFWAAFHDLAKRVPCDECRDKAESFMVFFHDMVNVRVGKPVYDEKNFKTWVTYVSNLGEERKKRTDRKVLAFISAIVVSTLIIVIVKTKNL